MANPPSARKRVPLAKAERVGFWGDSRDHLEEKLNEYLASYNSNYELASVQQLETSSPLATESTFEYHAAYLIAWRLRSL